MAEAVEDVEVVADVEIGPVGVEAVVEVGDRAVPFDLGGDHPVELGRDHGKAVLDHVLLALGRGAVEALDQEDRQQDKQAERASSQPGHRTEQPGSWLRLVIGIRLRQVPTPDARPGNRSRSGAGLTAKGQSSFTTGLGARSPNVDVTRRDQEVVVFAGSFSGRRGRGDRCGPASFETALGVPYPMQPACQFCGMADFRARSWSPRC